MTTRVLRDYDNLSSTRRYEKFKREIMIARVLEIVKTQVTMEWKRRKSEKKMVSSVKSFIGSFIIIIIF